LGFFNPSSNLGLLMLSLAQLLGHHGCILVQDAASSTVHVGLLREGQPAIWHSSPDEAGKAIFQLTETCLWDASIKLSQVRAFAYCAGPGSMLGVRTVAMALRTWQALAPRPVFAYLSLPLIAHELAQTSATRPFAVIADARRDTWHTVNVAPDGTLGTLQRTPSAELATGSQTLFQSTAFRAWATAPRATQPCDYPVPQLLERHRHAPLFTEAPTPDAFQHEAPEYKKWSAQVHSAATANPK